MPNPHPSTEAHDQVRLLRESLERIRALGHRSPLDGNVTYEDAEAAIEIAAEALSHSPAEAQRERAGDDVEHFGIEGERDESDGSITVRWRSGEWVVAFASGKLIFGSSPALLPAFSATLAEIRAARSPESPHHD